jgi:hypothetical protein
MLTGSLYRPPNVETPSQQLYLPLRHKNHHQQKIPKLKNRPNFIQQLNHVTTKNLCKKEAGKAFMWKNLFNFFASSLLYTLSVISCRTRVM